MFNTNEEYLTIEETAKKFKVAPATVYRMAQKGEIPAVKFGKVWRIDYPRLKEKLDNKTKPESSN